MTRTSRSSTALRTTPGRSGAVVSRGDFTGGAAVRSISVGREHKNRGAFDFHLVGDGLFRFVGGHVAIVSAQKRPIARMYGTQELVACLDRQRASPMEFSKLHSHP